MEKIERTETPDWLEKNWQKWGEDWKAKYEKNKKSSDFNWRQYKNKGKKHLLEELSTMTQAHCSYCDSYPMFQRIPSTIDHFKPKTRFPLDAYKWENLFLSCGLCQSQKRENFNEHLLKPDHPDYDFDRYFDINWQTGEIIPNPAAPEEDQKRAKESIELFGLNENGKPDDRCNELMAYENRNNPPTLDQVPYRFFIKRGKLS